MLGRIRWKIVMGVAGLALVGFFSVVVPRWLSTAIETALADVGMDVAIEDWSVDYWKLAVTAHDVEVRARGPFARPEVLEIDRVTVDYSLWKALTLDPGHIQRVILDEPRLYLERHVSGDWNWSHLIDRGVIAGLMDREDPLAVSAGPRDSASHSVRFEIGSLELDDLEVAWVENLEGESGQGFVHRSRAELYIDHVHFLAEDLAGLVTGPESPQSRFVFEGRINDGVVALRGDARFFQWVADDPGADVRLARGVAWQPQLGMELFLENIPAAVLARFMPDAALLPASGSLSGRIQFTTEGDLLRCSGQIDLRQVGYAPNPTLERRQREKAASALASFQSDESVEVDCEGELDDREFRPVQAVMTKATARAVEKSSNDVRVLAYQDTRRYDESAEVPPGLERTLRQIERTTRTIEEVDRNLRAIPRPSRMPGMPRLPRFP